jgi:hypothetical protein
MTFGGWPTLGTISTAHSSPYKGDRMSDPLRVSLGILTIAVALLVPVAVTGQSWTVRGSATNADTTKAWTSPLTPDGQPDLQGVWLATLAGPRADEKAAEAAKKGLK